MVCFFLLQLDAREEVSDWSVVHLPWKAEWRSASTMHGELSVTTPGTTMMLQWSADSWATLPSVRNKKYNHRDEQKLL